MATATWDFVNQCALNLIQIKVSLMEPLEAGLQAQVDAAHSAVLPWYSMMVWPISINVRAPEEFSKRPSVKLCV